MKKLLFVGMMLLGAAAQAQTVDVASVALSGGYSIGEYWSRMSDFRATFNINKALGRAWVEVNLSSNVNGHGNDIDHQLGLTGRWLVPGLRYDAVANKIFYNDVAVADVKPGLFGLGYYIQNTAGEPKLDVKEQSVDDGFNVYKELFEVVTLEIK